jgi:hypothetical protein
MAERQTPSLSGSPDRRRSLPVPKVTWPANGGGTQGLDQRPAARAELFRRPVPEKVPSRAPKRCAVAPSCRELRPTEQRREKPDILRLDRPRRHNAAPTGRSTNKIGTRSACPRAQPTGSRDGRPGDRSWGRSNRPQAIPRPRTPGRPFHYRMPASSPRPRLLRER